MDCFFCGMSEQTVCTACNLTGCCREHQFLHTVDQECLPYRVEYRPDRGNTLVAIRDIKPFQIILQDKPAVFGPFDQSGVQCLECCIPLEKVHPCSKCSLPLCSTDSLLKYLECENGVNHLAECQYFENSDLATKDVPLDVMNTCIAPLRQERSKIHGCTWQGNSFMPQSLSKFDHVLPFLKENSTKEVDIELFCKIIGIFRTNSVKWEKRFGNGHRIPVGHALCPIFSLLCHNCINNTRYTVANGTITVRACVPIKKGEEITTQYRGPNEGNLFRRQDFFKNWMFDCTCTRCQDPTELGTHSGTMVCSECQKPDLYPKDSTIRSDFECRSCSYKMEYSMAKGIFENADMMLMDMCYDDTPMAWEALLAKFLETFHPNHFICMKTSRILLQIYGSREGYTLSDMSEDLLERKLQLCRNYIEVFNVLEPGYRLWKGRLYEEMLGPLSVRLQQRIEKDQIGKLELMLEYKKIINLVKDASKCRQFLERNEKDDKRMGEFYKKWLQPLNLM